MRLTPGTRNETRKKSYEAGVDADKEAKRRREENLVENRKHKWGDLPLKKRKIGHQSHTLLDASEYGAAIESVVHNFIKKDLQFFFNFMDIILVCTLKHI